MQRPALYGGTDPNPLGKSPDHLGFLQLAKNWEASKTDIESALTNEVPPLSRAHSSPRLLSPVGSTPAIDAHTGNYSSSNNAVAASAIVPSSESWFSRFGNRKPQKEAFLGNSNRYFCDCIFGLQFDNLSFFSVSDLTKRLNHGFSIVKW